jgi:DNA-directed DNA polymerase III PolC
MSELRNFPTPHCHQASLDTASTPAAFAEREVQLGTGALTCTDHGSMGELNVVYGLAKKHGLTPILGLEGYVRDDNCPILTRAGIEKTYKKDRSGEVIADSASFRDYNKYYHITLHALNNDAYEAMVRGLSKADFRAEQHGSERKPLFDWSDIENLGAYDVTMTSGCLIGMVQRHLMSDRPDLAIQYYEKLRSIPKPGNFYVEIFPHRCDTYWESSVEVTLEGGEKLKLRKDKKLRLSDEKEMKAEELAQRIARGSKMGKLVALKHYSKWEEREAKEIVSCQVLEGFLKNECRPWCPDGDVQLGTNKFMLELAQRYGDKILISDDAHFATPDEKIVQDSRLGGAGGSWKFANSYHRQDSNEAYAYFRDVMGVSKATYEGWVENNVEWSQRFKGFKFVERKSLPTKFYPENTLGHLKSLIDKHGRMQWGNPEWVERLKGEIELLHSNGTIDLLPYFFLAEEVNYLYEEQEMLTGPGRGSAAGLLLTYVLGVTHVNPLQYKLSRDRFLTVDRIRSGKLPDIDMDFPDRDLLMDPKEGWLYKRFGDHVAAISTNTMLRLKSSLKDVCRSQKGYVDDETEALCKTIANPPQGVDDADYVFGYVGDDGKEVKGLYEESKQLRAYAQKYPERWNIVTKMLGIARQKSRHACAMVVANEPISNFIPLTTISGVRTTQYTAGSVEDRGGLKMDFLGLNSLKDIQACIRMVQERNGGVRKQKFIDGLRVPGFRQVPFEGADYDVWALPADQAVFRGIAEGRTETVFQLNTPSARQWLKEFDFERSEGRKAIDSIESISAFTALDRPGPLDAEVKDEQGNTHNMLVEYANRAKGMLPVGNIPALDEMLPETLGVMVYQEQLEAVYRKLTGCSAAEAEEFRRNVAKKKMDKVKAAYPAFIERAARQIGEEQAQAVFDQMVTFGQYGFNASHSVCYSVIAYACMFLKTHYPVEWWCAVLRNADKKEIGEKFWKHCRQWIDLPDIAHSTDNFEIQNDRIRAPLSFLMGVGAGAHHELVDGRPYRDIADFADKVNLTKKKGMTAAFDQDGKPKLDKHGNPKMRLGTSALNKGVVQRLIVAGVMDSLYPAGMVIEDKLQTYFNELAASHTRLFGARKRPDSPDVKYRSVDPLTRYQLRKQILPIYTDDLIPLVWDMRLKDLEQGKFSILFKPTTEEATKAVLHQMGKRADFGAVPLVSGDAVKRLNTLMLPEGQSVTVGTVGYVLKERRFQYQAGERKALSVLLDVGGEQFDFVKWPDYRSGRLMAPEQDLTGSIVIGVLNRYREDKPFSLEAIVVVQPPLDDGKQDNTHDEESESSG